MKLIVFLEDGLKTVEIFKPLIIGRSVECGLILRFSFVSKKHCTIALITDSNNVVSWVIIDGVIGREKSTNGTWINGERIEIEKIKDRDVLTFFGSEEIPKIILVIEDEKDIEENSTDSCEF